MLAIVDAIKQIGFMSVGFILGLTIGLFIGMAGLSKLIADIEPWILGLLIFLLCFGFFSLIMFLKNEKIEGIYYKTKKEEKK